ncbi:AraC family transcriptional regulator [Myceligenerans pegani]|uniref:AraC family transcriptional regulator n=1 Tax=Myceligenerans pegani TaxID=2776917 RepID=A0ABR9N5K8_9MICO|nr:AraC family transcriptional regulator [Myceligenerans sp. TRM 65318]MBE1878378.1 AraC family transcriptional regulator [Myceligenerans sp. TRM 65318]MBE3020649.1 AraC family transcriptional regulator [Myceligenerans sp. TRM 65318]
MDVLTDLLQRSRARGAAFSHSTARGEWGVRFPAAARLAIHGILAGEAFAWTDDGDPSAGRSRHVLAGDVVLIRGPAEQFMGHAPGAGSVPFAGHPSSGPPGGARRMTFGSGTGSATTFFCGAYTFEGDLCSGLLAGLPVLTVVRPRAGSGLRATLDVFANELLHDTPGQQALLDSLLDVILVQVLREQLAADVQAAPAWYRAMSDPAVGAALRAVHADPARPWTVARLAAEASLSRATFARRFTGLLGMSPLAYVTDWRMALACEQLRAGDAGLAAVARSLGYASEFSFAAAFKRHHGMPPGRWRATATSA